jgi:hypothetical protein
MLYHIWHQWVFALWPSSSVQNPAHIKTTCFEDRIQSCPQAQQCGKQIGATGRGVNWRTVFLLAPTSIGVSPTVLSKDADWSCLQNDVFYFFLKTAPWTTKILNNSKYLTFFKVSGSHSDVHGNSSRLGCYVMWPGKSHLEDVAVDGRTVLKLILNRMRERRLD